MAQDVYPISKNSVALAGEFAVLSQLMLQGYDANLTLGNTKAVDILAAAPSTGKMFKLEVKTARNRPQRSSVFGHTLCWPMNKKHEVISDSSLFYVFASLNDQNKFRFFIVPSAEVARYVRDQHSLWLQTDSIHKNQPHKDQPMRTFRIGLEESGKYPIPTPLAFKCENAWTFENKID